MFFFYMRQDIYSIFISYDNPVLGIHVILQ